MFLSVEACPGTCYHLKAHHVALFKVLSLSLPLVSYYQLQILPSFAATASHTFEWVILNYFSKNNFTRLAVRGYPPGMHFLACLRHVLWILLLYDKLVQSIWNRTFSWERFYYISFIALLAREICIFKNMVTLLHKVVLQTFIHSHSIVLFYTVHYNYS